jgi:hypothetical protein
LSSSTNSKPRKTRYPSSILHKRPSSGPHDE